MELRLKFISWWFPASKSALIEKPSLEESSKLQPNQVKDYMIEKGNMKCNTFMLLFPNTSLLPNQLVKMRQSRPVHSLKQPLTVGGPHAPKKSAAAAARVTKASGRAYLITWFYNSSSSRKAKESNSHNAYLKKSDTPGHLVSQKTWIKIAEDTFNLLHL